MQSQVEPLDAKHIEQLGIVVIGRNEGQRLVRALEVLLPLGIRVVYVDSNSSDGSADRVRALGAHVVELHEGKQTAARGRQTGFEELCRLSPDVKLVQFVDGDCILDRDWLAVGVRFLEAHPRAAAISGSWTEEFPERSIYNGIISLEWADVAGPADAPGGNSLCRVDALKAIGGWSVDLIAGEDPDLGFRLRDAGWEIYRLAEPMALHDINMLSFRSYWMRCIRSGYGYLEVGWRHRRGTGRQWLMRVRSAVFYALLLPSLALLGLVLSRRFSPWWIGASLIGCVAAAYARMLWVTFQFARHRRAPVRLALIYSVLLFVSKFANVWGFGRVVVSQITGTPTRLIEHKALSSPAGGDHPA